MEFDKGYSEWKSWGNAFELDPSDAAYFAGEFAQIPLSGARVLEIGFGEGRFIRWATLQGAVCSGCELIRELVDRGRALGFDVRHGSAQSAFTDDFELFDLIVALDVLEHIPNDQLMPSLLHLKRLLKPNGNLVVRTPNGESPFGRVTQYGDPTHVSVHSMGRFRQMALEAKLHLLDCRNAFRVVDPRGGWWGQRDKVRHWARNLFEAYVGFAYGFKNRPMDPNIVTVFRRSA